MRRLSVSLAGAHGRHEAMDDERGRSTSDGQRRGRLRSARSYLPAARRWKRVRFSIFLCFFLRMRLRRFLMSEPMTGRNLAGSRSRGAKRGAAEGLDAASGLGGRDSNPEVVDQNHACCRLHHPRWGSPSLVAALEQGR